MSMPEPVSAQIRAATPADAAQLAALRYRFRIELGAPNEGEREFVARASAWFASRLAGPAWRGWVATDVAGALVGQVLMQLVEKVPNPVDEAETIAYLTNIYVVPAWRGGGLGARLLTAALAACPAATVDRAVLWPSPASVSLYRRAGFGPPAAMLERLLRREEG